MLDIFNRGLLFITNITGYTSGKYSWKSYPVQRNSLATDSTPAGSERKAKAKNNSPDPQEPIFNLLVAAKGEARGRAGLIRGYIKVDSWLI